MTADMRRFQYALEPVRRREHWRLESLQALLGKVQRQLVAEKAELEELRQSHATQARAAERAFAERLDPGAHVALLRWLSHLRLRIQRGEHNLAELETRRAEAAERCRVQQRRVDAIGNHREECVAAFAVEEGGRQANESDREWLVRLAWERASRDPGEEGQAP